MGEKPTKLWYLIPIFFGIVGGIIGYFAVKDNDQKLANNLLIIGIVMTLIGLFFSFLIFLALFSSLV